MKNDIVHFITQKIISIAVFQNCVNRYHFCNYQPKFCIESCAMNIGIKKKKLGKQIKLKEFPPNCLNIIHNFGEKFVVRIFTREDLLTNVWIKTENHMPKYEFRVKLRWFLEMYPYDKCKFVLTFAISDNNRKRELWYFPLFDFTKFWM